MNLADSVTKIRSQLAEDSTYFPTVDIEGFYNASLRAISILMPSIVSTTSITIKARTWMYPLPSDLIRINTVQHSDGHYLTETKWEDMDLLGSAQWEGEVTTPTYQYWLWFRPRHLIVWPVVSSAAGSLTTYYLAESTDLSGTQETLIPDQFEPTIHLYTRTLALIADRKFNQAQPLVTQFFEQLNQLGQTRLMKGIAA